MNSQNIDGVDSKQNFYVSYLTVFLEKNQQMAQKLCYSVEHFTNSFLFQ